MPRTIEHQIKLLDRPSTPPSSGHSPSPYGSPSAIDVQSHFPSEAEQAWRMGNSGTSSMRVPVKPARKHRQHQPIHQTSSRQADEVAYGTESFERNFRYSPNEIERQHFSSRSFGDQRSMGGDGESRANVRFEDEEPARPIDPNYENPDPFDHRTHRSSWSDEEKQNVGIDGTRLLQRTKHLDTQPIRIPRPHMDKTSSIPSPASHKQRISQPVQSSSASFSPGRQSWRTAATSSSGFGRSSVEDPERMTRDRDVPTADLDASSTSNQPSGGLYWATGVPMKKVIRKSRWISIHDGRPKSDFVETVHYVPAFSGDNTTSRPRHQSAQPRHAHFNIPAELWTSSSSCSLSSTEEVKPSSGRGEPNVENRRKEVGGGHRQPQQNSIVYVTHNPIYSIGL